MSALTTPPDLTTQVELNGDWAAWNTITTCAHALGWTREHFVGKFLVWAHQNETMQEFAKEIGKNGK